MKRLILGLLVLLVAVSIGLAAYWGNVASANGSGHSGNLTLSFGAFDHGEASYTGQATFMDDIEKTKITIDVECLSVNGNVANIGGEVRKSTWPSFPVGSGVHFFVWDNGEGIGSSPDLFSFVYLGGCGGVESGAPVPMESDAGNIQVRFVAPDKDCTKCPVGTHCAGNGECVGGGHLQCPDGYYECCDRCVLINTECPAACAPK